MSLNKTDVLHIANLANIKLKDNEHDIVLNDLNQILTLIDTIHQTDTDHTLPLLHPSDVTLLPRADEVTESNQREQFQTLAPEIDGGYYLVPKVIE